MIFNLNVQWCCAVYILGLVVSCDWSNMFSSVYSMLTVIVLMYRTVQAYISYVFVP